MPTGACVFYVDALRGHDDATGTSAVSALASLIEARDRVRVAKALGACAGAAIELGVGRHFIAGPLTLNGDFDSGRDANARVEWRGPAAGVASISAGVQVTDWHPVPGEAGLWEAPLPAGTSDMALRQMWVGGRRAKRDRRRVDASLWTATGDGYRAKEGGDADGWYRMQRLMPAGDGVELVYAQGGSPWTEPRCGVREVMYRRGETYVQLQDPCWRTLRNRPWQPCPQCKPTHVENDPQPRRPGGKATALRKGTFFVHRDPGYWSGTVRYAPRDAADLDALRAPAGADNGVFFPISESILVADRVRHVSFTRITFEHATWREPSGSIGYVPQQSGTVNKAGYNGNNDVYAYSAAALTVLSSRDVSFDKCTFTRMGSGAALHVQRGSQKVSISGCLFTDLSGSAVRLGDLDDWAEPNAARQSAELSLTDSVVRDVANEYTDHCAVFLGYVRHSTVAHNRISDAPYTAISLGWGWGREVSYAAENDIEGNHIERAVRCCRVAARVALVVGSGLGCLAWQVSGALVDGGSIYTLGPMPDTTIERNVIVSQSGLYAALYYDNGAAGITATQNVIRDSGAAFWLLVNPSLSARNLPVNVVHGNWIVRPTKGEQSCCGVEERDNAFYSSVSRMMDASSPCLGRHDIARRRLGSFSRRVARCRPGISPRRRARSSPARARA